MYYIGTDRTFIRVDKNGKAVATSDFGNAKLFSDKVKAGQFLVSLPRKMYEITSKWEVKEYNYQPAAKPPEIPSQAEETTANTYSGTEVDYIEVLTTVSVLKENKKGCMTALNGNLSDINQEIVDLEHYIEFSKLNVSEGYKAYKMLRDTLRERRKIKDSITAAQSLYENCNVDKLYDCNDRLHNRTYTPRKLTSLFE